MASVNKVLAVSASRFCTALRFLTLLPISWRAEEDAEQFPHSLMYFSLVGAVIGGIGCLVVSLSSMVFPQQVTAVLGIGYLAFISGCLHLDGLSDSADGLLSSRPRDVCLDIMKDSRAGPMGVIMVIMVLMTKFAALSSMPQQTLLAAMFFMPFAGRCAILVTMAVLPYARKEGGLGTLFYSGDSKKAAAGSLVFFLAVGLTVVPWQILAIAAGFLATNALFNRWCKTKLGGATGDTLGAICELTEMITAVSMTALSSLNFQP